MFKSKNKPLFASLFLAAALIITACSKADKPVIKPNGAYSGADESALNPHISSESRNKEENVSAETDVEPAASDRTESAHTADTEGKTVEEPTETDAPETVSQTAWESSSETPPQTEADVSSVVAPSPLPTTAPIPAPKWTETESDAEIYMYINTDGVFSREQALEDSRKVKRYSLNDGVKVVARTNTGYCKLDGGDYIHSSYLDISETEKNDGTEATTLVSAETDTAATTFEEPPAETEAPTGNYGQREHTQTEKDFAKRVFELTNEERAKAGLPAFRNMDDLDVIASVRAWELTVEYRPDHTRPDGTSCQGAFNENGIVYGSWGENIAAGQASPESVVEAWMNSPSHRDAILSTEYTHMGAGCYYVSDDHQGYYYFWTQEFYCF